MRLMFFMSLMFVLMCSPLYAYKALTDDTNGGNPVLDKKKYKVYIQTDPTGKGRDQDVKDAVNKWKAELAQYGVTLEIQAGDPPQTPLDQKKLNEEIEKFNKDAVQDITKYPELSKSKAKELTVSVYWESTEDITKRAGGGGAERGLASNSWDLDVGGKANKIESSDVFLPTDPPGAAEEVKKRIIHNISMHEMGHVAGFDHYTPAQEKTGDIMEKDATLHDKKLDLSDEEKKGLKSFYSDNKSSMNEHGSVKEVDVATLDPKIIKSIPSDLSKIYEYDYDFQWLGGEEINYVQIQTGGVPLFYVAPQGGMGDWLMGPFAGENYFKAFADADYLNEDNPFGSLQLFTAAPPGEGWVVYSTGNAVRDVAPVPEPGTLAMFSVGLLCLVLANPKLFQFSRGA